MKMALLQSSSSVKMFGLLLWIFKW